MCAGESDWQRSRGFVAPTFNDRATSFWMSNWLCFEDRRLNWTLFERASIWRCCCLNLFCRDISTSGYTVCLVIRLIHRSSGSYKHRKTQNFNVSRRFFFFCSCRFTKIDLFADWSEHWRRQCVHQMRSRRQAAVDVDHVDSWRQRDVACWRSSLRRLLDILNGLFACMQQFVRPSMPATPSGRSNRRQIGAFVTQAVNCGPSNWFFDGVLPSSCTV